MSTVIDATPDTDAQAWFSNDCSLPVVIPLGLVQAREGLGR